METLGSARSNMNDSSSIRESIYNEWYAKKLETTKAELTEKQQKKKEEEECKAQTHIEKMQKSQIVFKMWSDKKEHVIQEQRKKVEDEKKKKK